MTTRRGAGGVIRSPAFTIEAPLTIVTRVTVPKLFGLLRGMHDLPVPTLSSITAAATGSIGDDHFAQVDLATLPTGTRESLLREYLAALRALHARLGDVRETSWCALALDGGVSMRIELPGHQPMHVPCFAMGVQPLAHTLSELENLGAGKTLVFNDDRLDGADPSPYAAMGEFWSASREGVVLRFSDLDAETDEEAETVHHVELGYADFTDAFSTAVRPFIAAVHQVSDALGLASA